MEIIIIAIVVLVILVASSIVIIPQQSMGIIERLGKYNRILGAGLHFRIPLIDKVSGKESIRIRQLDVPVETKTQDNVFVNLGVDILYAYLDPRVRYS